MSWGHLYGESAACTTFSIFRRGCNPMPSTWNIYIFAQSAQSCWWQRKVITQGDRLETELSPSTCRSYPMWRTISEKSGNLYIHLHWSKKLHFLVALVAGLLSCEMFDLSIFDVRCSPGKWELVEVCIAPDTKLADICGKNLCLFSKFCKHAKNSIPLELKLPCSLSSNLELITNSTICWDELHKTHNPLNLSILTSYLS